MDIKYGSIEYFTLLGLRDELNYTSLNKLGLQNLDKLKFEIDVKIAAINESAKIKTLTP